MKKKGQNRTERERKLCDWLCKKVGEKERKKRRREISMYDFVFLLLCKQPDIEREIYGCGVDPGERVDASSWIQIVEPVLSRTRTCLR